MLDTSVKNLMFDLGAGREIYDADSGISVHSDRSLFCDKTGSTERCKIFPDSEL